MPAYSVGNNKAGVNTANTVMWQIKTAASNRIRIRELGIFISSAPTTAPIWVLARSTALGTSSTTTAGQPLDTTDAAATGTLDSAWSSAPTFNTSGPFIRQVGLPTTAGNGIIWTFAPGEELVIPASAGLCIANTVAAGATVGSMSFYATWLE